MIDPDPYDADLEDDQDEADLWFVPAPPEEEPDFLSPLPRSSDDELSQIADWQAAQRDMAGELADAARLLGVLDEMLRRGPKGWTQRIALTEAAQLGWITGSRLSVERLGLWTELRLSHPGDDARDLERGSWAYRRLAGNLQPLEGMKAFLNRTPVGEQSLLEDKIEGWSAAILAAQSLHPIALGCFAHYLWPLAGIGSPGDKLECSVVGARIAAQARGAALRFAPIAMGGYSALLASGPAERKLRYWIRGVGNGASRAIRILRLLEDWSARAAAETQDLSGKTHGRLLTLFAAWPMISAPTAEKMTGVSRASVQRNLDVLQQRGLISEVTDQSRFRVWTANIGSAG